MLDGTVHSWDLAQAIGERDQLSDDLVRFTWDILELLVPTLSANPAFGPPVEHHHADGPLEARLLSALGRTVVTTRSMAMSERIASAIWGLGAL
ncbi:MAG: hypothetical protein AB7W59_24270 [Acidimicrobiia bacterium]